VVLQTLHPAWIWHAWHPIICGGMPGTLWTARAYAAYARRRPQPARNGARAKAPQPQCFGNAVVDVHTSLPASLPAHIICPAALRCVQLQHLPAAAAGAHQLSTVAAADRQQSTAMTNRQCGHAHGACAPSLSSFGLCCSSRGDTARHQLRHRAGGAAVTATCCGFCLFLCFNCLSVTFWLSAAAQ
jgi:hypothetical protein